MLRLLNDQLPGIGDCFRQVMQFKHHKHSIMERPLKDTLDPETAYSPDQALTVLLLDREVTGKRCMCKKGSWSRLKWDTRSYYRNSEVSLDYTANAFRYLSECLILIVPFRYRYSGRKAL